MLRRDFIRLAGIGAAGLATGCGDNTTGGPDATAAVLEPTSEALIVTVFAAGARSAIVEIRDGNNATTATIPLAASGAGAIDLAGLAPATTYEIAVDVAGGRLGPFTARTAPRDDDPRPVRIAVVADVDPNPEFETDLVAQLVAASPDLIVGLGDYPYTDNGPVAETVEAYRARHAEIRALPRFRALVEAAPICAIYDDHEFRNNWDAMRAAAEPERYAAAMTVWDEFFPLRDAAGDTRFRSWRYGANVECFLLDCRRFRSANAAPDDAQKTMLGAAQRDWLLAGLAASTAPFKLVFTSVPLGFGSGDDHWESFATERAAILDAVVGISGVLFIAADQHWFAAHRHVHGVREIQVGPLARGIADPSVLAPGVLFRATEYNVGLVDVMPDRLVVTGLGPGGTRFYEETLTAADLTPRRS